MNQSHTDSHAITEPRTEAESSVETTPLATVVEGLPDDACRTLEALWGAPPDVARISLAMLGSGSRAALRAYRLITDDEMPELTDRGSDLVAALGVGELGPPNEKQRLEAQVAEALVPDLSRRLDLLASVGASVPATQVEAADRRS